MCRSTGRSTNRSSSSRSRAKPKPRTLRVQGAVSKIGESSTHMDVASAILPVGWVASYTTGKPMFVGEMASGLT
ncbi:MAG: DUF3313 family protein [Deltaproteobacteria bacterium]|nr:DUF3313 family protein [Deltaproteobacteria bacterium]